MGHGDHVATHFLHTMLCFFGDSMGYTKLSEHYWALIINLKGDSNSMEDNEDHHCTSHQGQKAPTPLHLVVGVNKKNAT